MLCFRTVPVAKIVMDKKGEHQKFPSILFLSLSARKFQGGTLLCCVSEKFRQRKSLGKRGWGSNKIFQRKALSHCAKKGLREPFSFSLIPRIERLYASQ